MKKAKPTVSQERKKERRCPECGGLVVPRRAAGRTMPYRNLAALEVPDSFPLPTCVKCGEEYLSAAETDALDAALEAEYARVLSGLAQQAMERLSGKVTKQELERAIGLSQGYLSKLPEKTTSPLLVTLLWLIAADPGRNLELARSVWKAAGPKKGASESAGPDPEEIPTSSSTR